MKKWIFSSLAASLFVALCQPSFAAVIVQYDAANNGVFSVAPVIEGTGIDGDDLVAGSGLTSQSGSTFNFSSWDTASTTYEAAVAANDSWTWGFDVTSGPVVVETMDIRLDRSGSGPDDFDIRVAVNGGTPVSILTHDYMDSSSGVNFLGVDLSTAVGTLSSGDSVVFTLAAFNSESDGGTFDLENITFPGGNDGIVINGQLIPEPTTLAMIALGSAFAGIVGLRRRWG